MAMEAKDNDIESLLHVNAMTYVRPAQASLVSQRTTKIGTGSQSVSVPGDTITFISSTGSDMIYGPTSALRLELTVANGGNFLFGENGSVLQLIKSIRITHRSGEDCSFIDNAGVLADIRRHYTTTDNQKAVLDLCLNTSVTSAAVATDDVIICMIPLSILDPFFNSHMLIPAQVMAGLKIDIQFNNSASAVTGNTTVLGSIKATLRWDSFHVFDAASRELLMQASDQASSGIQYVYESAFNTGSEYGAGITDISFDVQQASSIVSKVIAVFRPAPGLIVGTGEKSRYLNCVVRQQVRIGSLYLPNQVINVTPVSGNKFAENSAELFWTTAVAQAALPNVLSVLTGDQAVTIPAALWTSGLKTAYIQALDRNPGNLDYSGQPSNNSRLINVAFSLTVAEDPNNSVKRMDIFTLSTRVLNVFGDSAVVDR
jgi:hypothetical protein